MPLPPESGVCLSEAWGGYALMMAVVRHPDRWGDETLKHASASPEMFDDLDLGDVGEILDWLAVRLRL